MSDFSKPSERTGDSTVVINGKPYELAGEPTVKQFLDEVGLGKRRVIVEHNGEPLPSDQLEVAKLAAGDRLEVAQLVGGG